MFLSENQARRDALKVMLPLLELLQPSDRELLEENISLRHYKKHEIIYYEGQHAEHLFCVVFGTVKIIREGVCGRPQIIRMLGSGHYFGYRASIANEPYVTSAAAFGPVVLCVLPMTLVAQVMLRNATLQNFFMTELASDLGVADKRIVSLTQKHIRGRLAESLLAMRDNFGLDIEGFINLDITREEIACYANMTTSNAIRTISAFSHEELIVVNGKRIKLLKDEELLHISMRG
ncbi:MAG: Crp/Fnr family transcriptional regulator [Bacteroidaceae bacterium]|nr:Crp/Fnr family transcriptional regulator [Bacteroidaceae bacterium]